MIACMEHEKLSISMERGGSMRKGRNGNPELLEIDGNVLNDVLYGRWPEWGGQKPPDHVRQQVLHSLSKDVLSTAPPEIHLDVSGIPGSAVGVFASSTIPSKTEIGPLPGKQIGIPRSTEHFQNAWEVMNAEGDYAGILSMENCQSKSWMAYIQCARHSKEQNLEVHQSGDALYYRVMKDIEAGEELLAWYGAQVPQCLGIPTFNEERTFEQETNTDVTEEKRKVKCVLCQKGFNSRSNLRSHMRTHTLHKPFRCSRCPRTFSQSSTLRNHTRLHTGEKPYKCNICQSAYSQLAGLRAHQRSSQHRPKLFVQSSLSKII